MARGRQKFTAVATAWVVLVANALCICRTANAAIPTQAEPAARHCCTHSSPDKTPDSDHPSRDSDGHCRHCDGFAAPAVKVGHTGVADVPALDGPGAKIVAGEIASVQLPPVSPDIRRSEFFSPPTLLRLCCALNL